MGRSLIRRSLNVLHWTFVPLVGLDAPAGCITGGEGADSERMHDTQRRSRLQLPGPALSKGMFAVACSL